MKDVRSQGEGRLVQAVKDGVLEMRTSKRFNAKIKIFRKL